MYTISGRVDSAVPSMILASKLYALCILHVLNQYVARVLGGKGQYADEG